MLSSRTSPAASLRQNDKAVITCSQVHKSFQRRVVGGGYTTFKTQLVQWLAPRRHREQITKLRQEVLKGLDFVIRPGETVGIIGQNGAGKSTLLKLLTGIYRPSAGTIERNGRISALLELGAGFHPEFSGRENIYMNGMILGLSKSELRLREQEIIDFAELRDSIDAPVRTYSSGMYMRLAFAIAVNVDPDILIVDEILSVGDEHFQHKSKAKIDEFKAKGTSIVLVTHDLDTVERWCTRAIWLEQGRIAEDGDPRYVVGRYRSTVALRENAARVSAAAQAPVGAVAVEGEAAAIEVTATPSANRKRWGDGRIKISRVTFIDDNGDETTLLHPKRAFVAEIAYETHTRLEGVNIGIGFHTSEGQWIWGTNTKIERVEVPPLTGTGIIRVVFPATGIVGRNISVDIALEDQDHAPHDYWINANVVEFEPVPGPIGCVHVPVTWQFSNELRASKTKPTTSQEVRDLYTKDYFLTDCGGFASYSQSGGKALSDGRLGAAVDIAAYVQPSTVLDMGCGRGEMVYYYRKHLGARVVGVDYSDDALTLAKACFSGEEQLLDRVSLINADASTFQPGDAFDLIVATDLIEHLGPSELARMYATLAKHLSTDGIFVGHTFPNRWYYQHGYRRRREKALAAGEHLPAEPRTAYELAMHINEQSPAVLKRQLRQAFPHVELWFSHGDPGGSLVRAFSRDEMINAPSLFFVAANKPIDKQRLVALCESKVIAPIDVRRVNVHGLDVPSEVDSGSDFTLTARVDNQGGAVLGTRGQFPVHLSYHWHDAANPEASVYEGLRTPLIPSIQKATQRDVVMRIAAPSRVGRFQLVLTLVQEGVAWFETASEDVASRHEVTVVTR